jgi:hypothetical protein
MVEFQPKSTHLRARGFPTVFALVFCRNLTLHQKAHPAVTYYTKWQKLKFLFLLNFLNVSVHSFTVFSTKMPVLVIYFCVTSCCQT